VQPSQSLTQVERQVEAAHGALGSNGGTHLGVWNGSILTNNQNVKTSIQELETALDAALADAESSKLDADGLQAQVDSLESLPGMDIFWVKGQVTGTVGLLNQVVGYELGNCGNSHITEGVDMSEEEPPVVTPNGYLQGFATDQSYYIFGNFHYRNSVTDLVNGDMYFQTNEDPAESYSPLTASHAGHPSSSLGTVTFAFTYTPTVESPTLRLVLENVADTEDVGDIQFTIIKVDLEQS